MRRVSRSLSTCGKQNGASDRLGRLVRDLYQLKNDGTVVIIDEHSIPEQWCTSFHNCPDTGHTMRADKLAGLAAEIVYSLGNTKALWTGAIPQALIQMMRTEKMEEHKIRKAIRETLTCRETRDMARTQPS